jgi:hypothetical protein
MKEVAVMFSMNDYRAALQERDNYEMDSAAWKLAQIKVSSIVAVMVSSRNPMMVQCVIDDAYSLNDSGAEFDSEAVQYDLWLLETGGYAEEAQRIRELAWE